MLQGAAAPEQYEKLAICCIAVIGRVLQDAKAVNQYRNTSPVISEAKKQYRNIFCLIRLQNGNQGMQY